MGDQIMYKSLFFYKATVSSSNEYSAACLSPLLSSLCLFGMAVASM